MPETESESDDEFMGPPLDREAWDAFRGRQGAGPRASIAERLYAEANEVFMMLNRVPKSARGSDRLLGRCWLSAALGLPQELQKDHWGGQDVEELVEAVDEERRLLGQSPMHLLSWFDRKGIWRALSDSPESDKATSLRSWVERTLDDIARSRVTAHFRAPVAAALQAGNEPEIVRALLDGVRSTLGSGHALLLAGALRGWLGVRRHPKALVDTHWATLAHAIDSFERGCEAPREVAGFFDYVAAEAYRGMSLVEAESAVRLRMLTAERALRRERTPNAAPAPTPVRQEPLAAATPPAHRAQDDYAQRELRKEADGRWTIAFRGDFLREVPDRVGFRHLAIVLDRAPTPVSVFDLRAAMLSLDQLVGDRQDQQESPRRRRRTVDTSALDAEARRLRDQLDDLNETRGAPTAAAAPGAVARAGVESEANAVRREEIKEQLREIKTQKNRLRDSDRTRSRTDSTVSTAIKRALRSLEGTPTRSGALRRRRTVSSLSVGQYLLDHLSFGKEIVYTGDPWIVRQEPQE